MAFSDLEANIAALFTTSTLYGINAVTFFACMRVLMISSGRIKTWRRLQYIMITAALAMFSVATLDIGIILGRCVHIFINNVPESITTFAGISNWWNIVEFSNTVVQTFIADGILICRCWVLWNQRCLIVLGPVVMCCVGTGLGIAAAVIGSTAFHPSNLSLRPFIIPFLALTFATNATTSSLVVFRIKNVGRKSRPYLASQEVQGSLSRAIHVTSQAGLMYTTSILVLLITYSIGHPSQIIVGRALVQIIGIVFNLIISTRARQGTSPTRTPVVALPLDTMIINQETIVSHDPPDRQGQRIAERSKRNKILW